MLTELLTNVGEKGDGVSPLPLTIRVKFVKLIPLLTIAPSSNGKTADSGLFQDMPFCAGKHGK